MPVMNGRQFIEALCAEPAYIGIPVMMITQVHGLSANLVALGASDIFEKPFDLDDLLNKVNLAVDRSRDSNRGPK